MVMLVGLCKSMAGRVFASRILMQTLASLLFGVSSVLIMAVNKTILTSYKFPSFQVLGLGQIITTIVVLGGARWLQFIDFPGPSTEQIKKVFPLPIFYIFNLVFGLGSTKKLNLPMFTVLRRFTLIFVSIGQIYILDQYESLSVNMSLVMMIAGALIAALNDLAFNVVGYVFVLINDVCTAANILYSKKKLNSEMTKYEIMFYNALLVFVPASLWSYFSGDMLKAYEYTGWSNPWFLLNFFLSCIMGFVLIYSQILVTQVTSPLTLSVVGCIKNVVVTYGGIYIGGDYIFDTYNLLGINISVFASLFYSYLKYNETQAKSTETTLPTQHADTDKETVEAS